MNTYRVEASRNTPFSSENEITSLHTRKWQFNRRPCELQTETKNQENVFWLGFDVRDRLFTTWMTWIRCSVSLFPTWHPVQEVCTLLDTKASRFAWWLYLLTKHWSCVDKYLVRACTVLCWLSSQIAKNLRNLLLMNVTSSHRFQHSLCPKCLLMFCAFNPEYGC